MAARLGHRATIRSDRFPIVAQVPFCTMSAEGLQLKTWRGGPQAGGPKLPPSAPSLLDRGLMRLDADSRRATAILYR